ncbi:MAG: cyclopropane fatty acyl phospholipid synthase [Candidatus Krumholzibacteriia bacterium]
MAESEFRGKIADLLNHAGITIDGSDPHDIRVHDSRLYGRVIAGGSLALAEAYMDGWWDCHRLDEFFARVLRARLDEQVRSRTWFWAAFKARLFNRQTIRRAAGMARRHYDLGNDLYRRMLDRRMIYTCGYWNGARDLDEAQERKLDMVCRKLGFEPGMKVLDIGCGWGGAARFAAERYGVKVVGITISRRQADLARETCADLPVEVRLQDYREVTGNYDRIFSLGMFEHVGPRNHRTFMDVVRRCLAPDGLFLLHTIGGNRSVRQTEAFMDRYIFPGSVLPSALDIATAGEGLFVLEDWQNFGTHYDQTLMQWHRNFANAWNELKDRYDERFRRMWTYYLLSCAGSFRARKNQVWQLVLSPAGVMGGYYAPRVVSERSLADRA